jgi:hypothetical protein
MVTTAVPDTKLQCLGATRNTAVFSIVSLCFKQRQQQHQKKKKTKKKKTKKTPTNNSLYPVFALFHSPLLTIHYYRVLCRIRYNSLERAWAVFTKASLPALPS